MAKFQDIEVFHRDMMEDPTEFGWPWMAQYADGMVIGFDTEAEACAVQRAHRIVNGRNPETGEPLISLKRPCAVCGKELEHVDQENQPYGATEFTTGGHYGSTVFDPMDGTRMLINICDEHIRQWIEQGRTAEYRMPGEHGLL